MKHCLDVIAIVPGSIPSETGHIVPPAAMATAVLQVLSSIGTVLSKTFVQRPARGSRLHASSMANGHVSRCAGSD